MAFFEIPLPQDEPHITEQVILDGVTFTIECRWNERESSWYLSLYDVEGEPIMTDKKMVADWSLTYRLLHDDRPAGDLLVVDVSGTGVDPALSDIGERVILVYADEAEAA